MPEGKKNTIWTIIGVAIVIASIYLLSRHSNFIETILIESGALAPIVAIILYPLLAPTPITTDPITVVVSIGYGPIIGTIIAFVGNILSAIVEYYLGFKISKVTDFENKRQKLPFGLGKFPVDSIPFLIFGRMIPGYGSKIISFLAGAYKVPMKRYIWTTAVTVFLGSILLAFGGFGIVNVIKNWLN
jgi:uncharacterized membrane protein YdjX (TVP38/TMEM64 family)